MSISAPQRISDLMICLFCLFRCGHCKKLAPEYERLGASFKKAKSVLIAKVWNFMPQSLI